MFPSVLNCKHTGSSVLTSLTSGLKKIINAGVVLNTALEPCASCGMKFEHWLVVCELHLCKPSGRVCTSRCPEVRKVDCLDVRPKVLTTHLSSDMFSWRCSRSHIEITGTDIAKRIKCLK